MHAPSALASVLQLKHNSTLTWPKLLQPWLQAYEHTFDAFFKTERRSRKTPVSGALLCQEIWEGMNMNNGGREICHQFSRFGSVRSC